MTDSSRKESKMQATQEQAQASYQRSQFGREGLIVIDTRNGHVIPESAQVFDGTTMIPELAARKRGLTAVAWVDEDGTLILA